MKIYPVALLAFVVFVSACIGGGGGGPSTTTGSGIAINDFSSSVPDVEGGDRSVTITFEGENKGGNKIINSTTCLLGNNFNGSFLEGLWETQNFICQNKQNIAPPDPFSGTPGGTLRASWKLYSPCVPTTLSRTDQFTGRVYYTYNSSSSSSVWVYSENELKAAQQRGESVPNTLTVDKTVGPIEISLDTVQPVRYDSSGTAFTLKIIFSNVGGGVVFDKKSWDANGYWSSRDDASGGVPPIGDDELNVFDAFVTLPSNLVLDQSCSAGGTELKNIELRKGQSVTKTCEATLADTVTTKKSYPVTLTADYGYYIDSALSITAKGKKNDVNCQP